MDQSLTSARMMNFAMAINVIAKKWVRNVVVKVRVVSMASVLVRVDRIAMSVKLVLIQAFVSASLVQA